MFKKRLAISDQPSALKMTAWLVMILGAILISLTIFTVTQAQEPAPTPTTLDLIHPAIPLRDAQGMNVLDSGQPVSTLMTCGTCHDTAFIRQHSDHAQVGQNSLLRQYVVRTGEPLPAAWSSDLEMNCFLCHTASPNNPARLAALEAGDTTWANSATLADTGILEQVDGQWQWNAAAFSANGSLPAEKLAIQDPTAANCGQCHGTVHSNAQIPLTAAACDTNQWTTLTTGQIFSPQRIAASGLNIAGKDALSRAWDVHAERVLECTSCHYAANNPIYYQEAVSDRPDHLTFDPRRLAIADYLQRPTHTFTNEQDCQTCHTLTDNHEWLPYKDRHMEAVACETCHVPQVYAPALQVVDWTALTTPDTPRLECRGTDAADPNLITGFTPTLLTDDEGRIAPYNVVTSWQWVWGADQQPVPLSTLQAAWFGGEQYAPAILTTFDQDQDGVLSAPELMLDNETKINLIRDRLIAQGVDNPQISGTLETYALHHNVTPGTWAIRECETCHTADSRLANVLLLTAQIPGQITPTFDQGEIYTGADGALYFQPEPQDLYILGHDRVLWVDWLGAFIFLSTLLGVMGHGTLRYLVTRQHIPHQQPALKRVYMYSVYERQWHWLQTAVIFILLLTGLIIHRPDMFGLFSFRYIVQVHNVMAAILLINAALAAFYHLASGEIRQYLPQPRGFFNDAFAQALYYVRGIFRREPHPFEKTPEHKLNPLQQVTYLMLLNVLLPLQVITGMLMWGVQHWPETAAALGGLPFLAPFHTLIAWLFATFIVGHVYLTTTGHTPLANIKSMMLGWDDIEHQPLNTKEVLS